MLERTPKELTMPNPQNTLETAPIVQALHYPIAFALIAASMMEKL